MSRHLQAVLLAAGKGSRLEALTRAVPKPLLPVLGKPLIQHQVETLVAAGLCDIIIVLSEATREVASRLGTGRELGCRITYVHDPCPAGISASLELAEPLVTGRFAVFLADAFFVWDDFAALLEAWEPGVPCALVVRRDSPRAVAAACAVVADARGRVLHVLEKPAAPPTDVKGCGVYLLDRRVFDVLRRTQPSPLYGNEREISVSVQMLIDEGHDVRALSHLAWDVNVNRPEDLLEANLRALDLTRQTFHVGPRSALAPGASLRRTVVGERAMIGAGAHLENCVVFDGATVAARARPWRNTIFTLHGAWSAEPPVADASLGLPASARAGS